MAHEQPTRFTEGQMKLQKLIESWGLQTILEYRVGIFSLDIFCPELNLGVEFDGPFHHKHRDARRDRWILEFVKIKVFRYKTEEDNEELKKFLGVTDGERQTDPG